MKYEKYLKNKYLLTAGTESFNDIFLLRQDISYLTLNKLSEIIQVNADHTWWVKGDDRVTVTPGVAVRHFINLSVSQWM